jgi:hypothetical protein
MGDDFLARKDYAGASAVYEGVGAAVFPLYGTTNDENGDLAGVIGRCIQGLADCLPNLGDDPHRRASVVSGLMDAYEAMLEFDLTDVDIPSVVARHATAEERAELAGRIREVLEEVRGEEYADYRREALMRGLVALEGDRLGDEELLRIYREEGMSRELVDRLLALRRFEEAEGELERASEREVLPLADLFVRRHRAGPAERVVRSWAERARDHDVRFLEWLRRRAEARKDRSEQRELTEAIFRRRPSALEYKALRKLVGKRAEWEALRPSLLAALEKASKSELIRILLDEGEIDRAIAIVKAERKPPHPSPFGYGALPFHYGSGMDLEVAKAAEKDHPRDAIEIYQHRAESLVDARGRANYEEACRLLKRVKALFERLSEPDKWEYYVGVLRERHSSLRAFKEELVAAKL